MREEWIQELIRYYRLAWPNAQEYHYRRWAEGTLDAQLALMNDYLSRPLSVIYERGN